MDKLEAAKVVQRIGTALAHSLLAEARQPIDVSYEGAEGIDMNYTLCAAFYIHMRGLLNLVNMSLDLWVSVLYRLDSAGNQDLGFTIGHRKVPPCELKVYPMPSVNYAVEVIKRFFAYSLLPYYDMQGEAESANLSFLAGKYGDASGWGDTITVQMRAEDFPFDVDFREGVFRGFSDRMWNTLENDVKATLNTQDDLQRRIFSDGNRIGVVFMPKTTYMASKEVPENL